jgi:hypothetical protein
MKQVALPYTNIVGRKLGIKEIEMVDATKHLLSQGDDRLAGRELRQMVTLHDMMFCYHEREN